MDEGFNTRIGRVRTLTRARQEVNEAIDQALICNCDSDPGYRRRRMITYLEMASEAMEGAKSSIDSLVDEESRMRRERTTP